MKQETITIDIGLANDTEFASSSLRFEPSGYMTDSSTGEVIVPAPVVVELDGSGTQTTTLFPPDAGIEGGHYVVYGEYVIESGDKAATVEIGKIQPLDGGGPYSLAALLQAGGAIVGRAFYSVITETERQEVLTARDDAIAAVDAAQPYADRAAFEAATVPAVVNRVAISRPLGGVLWYVRDASGTAIQSADGANWSPDMTLGAYADHWAENTVGGATDMATAIQSSLDFAGTAYLFDNAIYACGIGFNFSTGDSLIGVSSSRTDGPSTFGSQVWFIGSSGATAYDMRQLTIKNVAIATSSASTTAHAFHSRDLYGSYFENVRFAHGNTSLGNAFYHEVVAGDSLGDDVGWNNHFIGCWFSSKAGYSCYYEGSDSFFSSPYFSGGKGARIGANGNMLCNVHTERADATNGDGLCLFDPDGKESLRATVSGLYADLNNNGLVLEGGRDSFNTELQVTVHGYQARSNTNADIVFRNTNSQTLSGGYIAGYTTTGSPTHEILEDAGTGVVEDYTVIRSKKGETQYISDEGVDFTVGKKITGNRFLASTLAYNRTGAASANLIVSSDGAIKRSTSARKYKKDIRDITLDEAYRFIKETQPVRYRSKSEGDPDAYSWYGYIADDVAKIDPRLVQFNDDGEPEGFNYDRVGPLLHIALLDVLGRLEALES